MTFRQDVGDQLVVNRASSPPTFAALTITVTKYRAEAKESVGDDAHDQNAWFQNEARAACSNQGCKGSAKMSGETLKVVDASQLDNLRPPGTKPTPEF